MLLSGIVFAGFISSILETPIRSNDYLHEHLNSPASLPDQSWVGEAFILPIQAREKLTTIVMDVGKSSWAQTSDIVVTGQALEAAQAADCRLSKEPCKVPFRLKREFRELHTNKDLRIANVEETSLRVTLKSDPKSETLSVDEIANETRLFRFYQTQNGWVQKTSEVLDETVLDFKDRNGKFETKLSTHFIGVNYYPASASWKEFWIDFPIEEIQSDLENINNMGANSVRIFLNHDYFDDSFTKEEAQAKLRVFLDLCSTLDIQVLVTLFDLRPDYTLSNITRDVDHIDRVLADISGHPAILGVDLKNQADLDFSTWGEDVVKAWLTVMVRHIQIQYPDIPVTIGWSNPEAALGLEDVVDFITYHEYGKVNGLAERLNVIKSEVGRKPVMITEIGSTIWSPFRSTRSAEAKQASRLKSQLAQSTAAQGVFVWTLNDFDHVGSEVVGRRPWRKAQQRHFGLLRPDGSSRPSKFVFQSHATSVALQSTHKK